MDIVNESVSATIPGGLDEEGASYCKLTDGFAIGVQLVMGLIVCSSLLIKRQREHPRRPLLIW
jgi:hypothetical protein